MTRTKTPRRKILQYELKFAFTLTIAVATIIITPIIQSPLKLTHDECTQINITCAVVGVISCIKLLPKTR